MSVTFQHLLMVTVFASAATAAACTSWVITPGVSKSGNMIVQKCRDSERRRLEADIRTSPRGWRWMRIGALDHAALFGMNEHGVVAIMNDGDDLTVWHPKGERQQTFAAWELRQIMTDCKNAAQGVAMLKNIARSRQHVGRGGSFFVADPKQAFLVDIGHGYAEAKEITGGICIISNCLHLPGIEKISRQMVSKLRFDRAREANTRAALQKSQEKGKYTPRGTFHVSRITCGREIKNQAPFRKNSIGGVCFEIDREYPAYLSCAYIALGPQQHTVYLPVPMAAEQMPAEMRSGEWGQSAYEFRDAAGDDHPALGRIVEFEDKLISEFESVREEARRLLKDQKKDEAVKLLNDTFRRQARETWEFISQLRQETPRRGGVGKRPDQAG